MPAFSSQHGFDQVIALLSEILQKSELENETRSETLAKQGHEMVEAAGVEPASLTELPAATTCLVRREFSTERWRPDTESPSLARRIRVSARHAQTPRLT